MEIELPKIPENIIKFAEAVRKAANENGIEKFHGKLKPKFKLRLDLDERFNGEVRIDFSNTDGRGRPANNLNIEMDASIKHTISSTPESYS